jgi:DNA (cytosine-5)-methyltransferase 1
MKFISLFAGIGGLDLGLARAGMQCVAQVEIDDFCQRVLQKNFPNVPKFKDVRNVGKHNLPAADLICGGFPCQPHSYAGKRRGKADDRNLWGEYLRVIREIQPRFVIGENVPGLITTMLDEILSDLENCGYTSETFIIPACTFDAPHRRNRVFIIAHSNGIGCFLRRPDFIATEAWEYAQRNASAVHTDVAYAYGTGLQSPVCGQLEGVSSQIEPSERSEPGGVFSANEQWQESWLEVAARLCRVDDGIPDRVDRLRSLGNAVVPQVAYWIGRRIMENS